MTCPMERHAPQPYPRAETDLARSGATRPAPGWSRKGGWTRGNLLTPGELPLSLRPPLLHVYHYCK